MDAISFIYVSGALIAALGAGLAVAKTFLKRSGESLVISRLAEADARRAIRAVQEAWIRAHREFDSERTRNPSTGTQNSVLELRLREIQAERLRLVIEALETLDSSKRAALEEALRQPSEEGRGRYLDKILARAQETPLSQQ